MVKDILMMQVFTFSVIMIQELSFVMVYAVETHTEMSTSSHAEEVGRHRSHFTSMS